MWVDNIKNCKLKNFLKTLLITISGWYANITDFRCQQDNKKFLLQKMLLTLNDYPNQFDKARTILYYYVQSNPTVRRKCQFDLFDYSFYRQKKLSPRMNDLVAWYYNIILRSNLLKWSFFESFCSLFKVYNIKSFEPNVIGFNNNDA